MRTTLLCQFNLCQFNLAHTLVTARRVSSHALRCYLLPSFLLLLLNAPVQAQDLQSSDYETLIRTLESKVEHYAAEGLGAFESFRATHLNRKAIAVLRAEVSQGLATVTRFSERALSRALETRYEPRADNKLRQSQDSILQMLRLQEPQSSSSFKNVIPSARHTQYRPQRTLNDISELREYHLQSGKAAFERF